ncbi:2-desacetyl-2-hydroxyethyl bacteriochlorophyllide A dehydrogenase [Bacillus sp. OV322]|uniref:NADP-dependent oxidoreductase n=1 Tax=Bacillus sp. OV322 TaxID=1882764 RepID=UPI0008EF603B|nr:NADP-dependent oxidoreductase [Bacillus sp. OV322]SFC43027.1 2-desacetyl-2-hydroxyethyl bacteriochlorophyllide A dehydrogenase [Bacillus sp. OV322]
MKAIVIEQYGGKEQLKEAEMKKPEAGENEIIIKLEATSINPIDWKLREGYLKEMLPFEFPIILGWDAAGTVDSIGSGVTDFKPGDRVFARPATTNRGTYAEYVAVDDILVAKIPDNVSFEEAASIPLAGLTAYQALFDFGEVKEDDKVLIHAGAGGVGSLAIQLAKNAGAYVATTAGTQNVEFMKSLGADEVIDYKKQDFDKILHDYDFVLDSMGGEIQEKSFSVLKEGGKMPSLVSEPDKEIAEKKKIKAASIWLNPNGQQLEELAKLMEEGKLKAIIGETFPLSAEGIRQAHEKSESHHAKGKIVIKAN